VKAPNVTRLTFSATLATERRKMDIGVPKSINSARSRTHALPALLSSYIFTTAYSFLSSRAALARLSLIEETLL
jgi:hypothetical protein